MAKRIRTLTQLDQIALAMLRGAAFARAGSMDTGNAGNYWSAADEAFINLGAYDHANLISVLRLEWAFDPTGLGERLRSAADYSNEPFPVAIAGQAATSAPVERTRLITLLKYHALKLVETWGFGAMFVASEKDARGFGSLLEMGYEFNQASEGWASQSTRPMLIGKLSRPRFAQALAYMAQKLGTRLNEFELEFATTPAPPGSWVEKFADWTPR
jgi:hypothetical protein